MNGRRCATPVAQPFLRKRLCAKGAPGGGGGEGSRANGRGYTPPFFVPPVAHKLWGHVTGRGLRERDEGPCGNGKGRAAPHPFVRVPVYAKWGPHANPRHPARVSAQGRQTNGGREHAE